MDSLFPGLADDIGEVIVARLPRWTYPRVSQISMKLFNLIHSGNIYAIRKRLNRKEDSVLMLPLLSPSMENLTLEVFLCPPDKNRAEIDEANAPCPVLASTFPFQCIEGIEGFLAREMIDSYPPVKPVQAIPCGTSVFVVGDQIGRYDMCSGLCSTEPSLLTPRISFAWVVVEDAIYIIGGKSTDTYQWLGCIERYSTNAETKGTQLVQDFRTVVQSQVGAAETCEFRHWVYGDNGYPILWLTTTETALLFGAPTEEGLSLTIQPSAGFFPHAIGSPSRPWLFRGRHSHVVRQSIESISENPELEDLLVCPVSDSDSCESGGLYWEFSSVEGRQLQQLHELYEYGSRFAIYECDCPYFPFETCSRYSVMTPDLFVFLGHMPRCLVEEGEVAQNQFPPELPAPQVKADWRLHGEHGIVLIASNYCPTRFLFCVMAL